MKIELLNNIQIDDQTELFHEVYEGEVLEKAGWLYLIYQNNDQEKVVIKIKSEELVMTRFGQPQTLMRFVKGQAAPATIPTPMGIQRLTTQTTQFQLDKEAGKLRLAYDLLTDPEASQALANYRLNISWKN